MVPTSKNFCNVATKLQTHETLENYFGYFKDGFNIKTFLYEIFMNVNFYETLGNHFGLSKMVQTILYSFGTVH